MTKHIKIQAGDKALAIIGQRGLSPKDVSAVAGAAGGPKWLILNGLDRYIFGHWLKNRVDPLYLIGSSIGAWRFAALSQSNPIAAMDRFESIYLSQTYSEKPSSQEVMREIMRVMDGYIDDTAILEILQHPFLRLNIMSDRCLGITGSQIPQIQGFGLLLAASANALNRRLLNLFFKRTLFYSPQCVPLLSDPDDGFPVQTVPLSNDNFRLALLASGAIPMVMEGVDDIPGAKPGVYCDGGVIDYHLDLPYPEDDGKIILFPHYSTRIIPGWFDKKLPWRKPSKRNMTRVISISPSERLVKSLPYQKIADRKDFFIFKGRDGARRKYWQAVVDAGKRMAEEFADLFEQGRLIDVVTPMFEN